MASLSIIAHGAPANALHFDTTKASLTLNTGEEVISVHAAQITVEDIKRVRGTSLHSHIGLAGCCAVGTTQTTGAPVFVAGVPCWADTVAAPAERVFRLSKLKPEEAACLPTYLTAWRALHVASVKAGDTILQHQTDSPVCHAIAQLGKALGITVVSLTTSELAEAQAAGKLREKYKSTCAVSGVTGRPISTLLRSLAPKGALVYYEGVNEPLSEVSSMDVPVSAAIFQDTKIFGVSWLNWVMTHPADVQKAIDRISDLLEKNSLSLKPTVFDTNEYLKAFEAAQSEKVFRRRSNGGAVGLQWGYLANLAKALK
eukprot:gene30343-36664_t